ncbi:MAG: hypothetical protein ABSG94_00030 [Brevinematales bacterium]|jgi:hypothetical protein
MKKLTKLYFAAAGAVILTTAIVVSCSLSPSNQQGSGNASKNSGTLGTSSLAVNLITG